ncbi:M48 family metalloprotease [Chitinophaga rhizophila]|uniref:Uncharacterized protein n=1 Tax=Chitinophaga rhizophila TaxID=2866212 RepID=A0ABS7G6P6_9BACT|nr:hypothetical protein [Chitinophaga rhizophila]MBW8683322.1 hypothetical protein [Chitinophaga rhizophila]
MNRIIACTLSLVTFFCMPASAQKTVKITALGGKSFCGFSLKSGFYNIGGTREYITREAVKGDNSGIPDVIQEIKNTLNFSVPIKVFIAAEEDNCFASIGENGVRMIIADQLFLNKVNKSTGTQWAAISIIAHEVGHHIAGFNRYTSQLKSELDADYWSGYILKKLGANQEAAVKCILYYGTDYDTSSHPNKRARAATIRQGWNDAVKGSYDPSRCESCSDN